MAECDASFDYNELERHVGVSPIADRWYGNLFEVCCSKMLRLIQGTTSHMVPTNHSSSFAFVGSLVSVSSRSE